MYQKCLVLILMLLTSCTSLQEVNNNAKTNQKFYTFANTFVKKDDFSNYSNSNPFVSLPIEVFTWRSHTASLPISKMGTIGRFVWKDDCLLFSPYLNNELITPIFYIDSLVDYKINPNGKDMLIASGQSIDLNEWYYMLATSEPKDNARKTWLVQRGKDNCLMDKVIYLNQSIIEPDIRDTP